MTFSEALEALKAGKIVKMKELFYYIHDNKIMRHTDLNKETMTLVLDDSPAFNSKMLLSNDWEIVE